MPPDLTYQQLFPHDTIRKGQEELIKDLDQAFSEKKILIAHAPTGMGKTAAALSVALKYALKEKKKIFFLTNRHTQHKIALDTLKQIQQRSGQEIKCVDLLGKKWMCLQEVAGLFGNEFNEYCKHVVEKGECEFYSRIKEKKNITPEAKLYLSELKLKGPLHNEELINFCQKKEICGYEMALLLAKDADVLIGDYNYLFNPQVSATLLKKMDLEIQNIILILDEGHNLPHRVTEMLSQSLSTFTLRNAIQEAKKFHYNGLISWLQELNRMLIGLAKFPEREKERKVSRSEFQHQVELVTAYENLIEELETAAEEVREKQRKSYLGGIANFLSAWKGDDAGYVRYLEERNSKYGPQINLHYSCLDPRIITSGIFSGIDAGIVMSGTLKPTLMYKDVLGIDKSLDKEYFSPFPAENKLSLIIPETSTKFTLRNPTMYKQIGDKCSELVKLIPGNVALFFPSYDLRDQIARYISSSKQFYWEKSEMSKEEKELLLEQFKSSKDKGAVLLGVAGANFAEGIDLPGDWLQGVVVVGLPLAKPDLITREIIAYYDQKFPGKGWDYGYIYPAMNKCLQSAGRCIRSETDRGVMVFLDARFAWNSYYCCFPKEGLIVSKEYNRLLSNFFNKDVI